MRKSVYTLFILCLLCLWALVSAAQGSGYPFGAVPFTAVHVAEGSFFGQRLAAAKDVTIPLAFSKCASEGRYDNFVRAAQPSAETDVSSVMGFPFDDTDVYKTIEGASYVLQTYPDAALEAYIDSVLALIAAAQEADGYLYTARTINPDKPHKWSGMHRWEQVENGSHELYNLGHMVDAACAHYQATGSKTFLDIAKRYADCVCRELGPGAATAVVPGHQIAEMALARLYLLTGEERYLSQAKHFLDLRGTTTVKNPYSQSHQRVVEQDEAVGHAVRAGYMYAGMADVAALTADTAYIQAIDKIWDNIINKKYYLTGGVGARHDGEAFGAAYELPNLTAYNETCAAIAMVYFAHRMFLLHGKGEYIDCLERTLYNGVLSGMSIDGGRFFYPNPLECDGEYRFNADNTMERQPWFGCACCPSNLCRFIPSIPGYMYAVRGDSIYVNLFGSNTATIATSKGNVTLTQTTNYPWEGAITLQIDATEAAAFTLFVRIPGWARGEVTPGSLYYYADAASPTYHIAVNGEAVAADVHEGYVALTRAWQAGDMVDVLLDMPPRIVKAIDAVEADRGRVAVERGPIVYCAEQIDNATDVPQIALATTEPLTPAYVSDLVGGVVQITAATGAKLIPYYAWCHRGSGKMAVWLREKEEKTTTD